MHIPFKYLGMTIGGNTRKEIFWEQVVGKITSQLSR